MTIARHLSTAQSRCGIGLRAEHIPLVMASPPGAPLKRAWFEVHAENYMGGGKALRDLLQIRRDHEVSLHGVGLSLGGAARPDPNHLRRFRVLAEELEPFLLSEHLAWCSHDGVFFNDLLPLPYTRESLELTARNVTIVQDVLQRRLLIENPSRYLGFPESEIPEGEFLGLLARRTGCGLLCDVNNLHVTAMNTGDENDNPYGWLDSLPVQAVEEIHLAGHTVSEAGSERVLIDDHASQVAEPVWKLYEHAVQRFPRAASLVEWDSDLPPLEVLLAEAAKADARRNQVLGRRNDVAA